MSYVGTHRGNDAGEIGLHLRITKLLDRLCQVRLGARNRCFRSGSNLHCVVQGLLTRRVVEISVRWRCSVALAFES